MLCFCNIRSENGSIPLEEKPAEAAGATCMDFIHKQLKLRRLV